MKHLLTAVLIFILSFNASAQLRKKLSKSKRERVVFHQETIGDKFYYYFTLDDVKIGPATIVDEGGGEFFQYDKKGRKHGTYINVDGHKIEVGNYKRGKKHGNSFSTKRINQVVKVVKYKNDKIKKDITQAYLDDTTSVISDTGRGNVDGFSNWSDGEVQIIGWWDGSGVTTPGLKRYLDTRDLYVGDFDEGTRDGFGVYKFESGKLDIGYSKNSKDHGLMMVLDKDNKVLFAGYFENDYYVKVYVNNQKKK